MSDSMNEQHQIKTGRGSSAASPDTTGGSALDKLLSTQTSKVKPTSLRLLLNTKCKAIRNFIDRGGSWDEIVAAASTDLEGRKVERRTVETYMAGFCSARKARQAAAAEATAVASTPDFEQPSGAGDTAPMRHASEDLKSAPGPASRATPDAAPGQTPRAIPLGANPFAPSPLMRRSRD